MTKIRIKLSRQEYETISTIIKHASNSVDVVDISSLYMKEALEELKALFLSKKYKSQTRYLFSFSIITMAIFLSFVGNLGAYEKAVCDLIYAKQIEPQVSRAIQMRMGFK
jgi:hypothetical protein